MTPDDVDPHATGEELDQEHDPGRDRRRTDGARNDPSTRRDSMGIRQHSRRSSHLTLTGRREAEPADWGRSAHSAYREHRESPDTTTGSPQLHRALAGVGAAAGLPDQS